MPDGIGSVCPCRPAVEGAPERASWAGSASRAPSWPNGTPVMAACPTARRPRPVTAMLAARAVRDPPDQCASGCPV